MTNNLEDAHSTHDDISRRMYREQRPERKIHAVDSSWCVLLQIVHMKRLYAPISKENILCPERKVLGADSICCFMLQTVHIERFYAPISKESICPERKVLGADSRCCAQNNLDAPGMQCAAPRAVNSFCFGHCTLHLRRCFQAERDSGGPSTVVAATFLGA